MAAVRRGFSLLELLVVVGILAALIGLLLPAVQRVRATAARARCLNNLHQIGVAVHGYHAAHNRLPAGVGATGPADPFPFLNWHAQLLPYLDQAELWARTVAAYQQNRNFTKTPPHTARSVVLAVFACPSDPRLNAPFFGPRGYGPASYLGVAGKNTGRRDGLLYLGSTHQLGDASDGAANTLLVGERPPSASTRFGWWYAGWGQDKDGELDGVLGARTEPRPGVGPVCDGSPERFQPGRLDDECATYHFWSPHPGGAHFLLADGSARFLTYAADSVLPALASRAGGETVAVPD